MRYCQYYQAYVRPAQCWYMVATLRSYEHMVFDRTLDPASSIFEFFVPIEFEEIFQNIINFYVEKGIVQNLQKLPNRFIHKNVPAEK
jgi:hypothetical protein